VAAALTRRGARSRPCARRPGKRFGADRPLLLRQAKRCFRSRGSCSDRCTRRLGLPPPAGQARAARVPRDALAGVPLRRRAAVRLTLSQSARAALSVQAAGSTPRCGSLVQADETAASRRRAPARRRRGSLLRPRSLARSLQARGSGVRRGAGASPPSARCPLRSRSRAVALRQDAVGHGSDLTASRGFARRSEIAGMRRPVGGQRASDGARSWLHKAIGIELETARLM
jgi:hypothetical protein